MPVEVLAEPLADRGELALPDLLVDVSHVLAQPFPDLDAHHVAERVGREVAEAAARPVNVLEHAVRVVGNLDAEVARHRLVPHLRQLAQVEAAHDLLLELEAEDDVQVVRRLVGLDADQPRPDVVDRPEPRLLVDVAELGRERRLHAWVEPAPERAAAADEVLPETRLRLVQAERRPARERRPLERRVGAALVEAVAALVHHREEPVERILGLTRRDPDVARRERRRERVRRGVDPPRGVARSRSAGAPRARAAAGSPPGSGRAPAASRTTVPLR